MPEDVHLLWGFVAVGAAMFSMSVALAWQDRWALSIAFGLFGLVVSAIPVMAMAVLAGDFLGAYIMAEGSVIRDSALARRLALAFSYVAGASMLGMMILLLISLVEHPQLVFSPAALAAVTGWTYSLILAVGSSFASALTVQPEPGALVLALEPLAAVGAALTLAIVVAALGTPVIWMLASGRLGERRLGLWLAFVAVSSALCALAPAAAAAVLAGPEALPLGAPASALLAPMPALTALAALRRSGATAGRGPAPSGGTM